MCVRDWLHETKLEVCHVILQSYVRNVHVPLMKHTTLKGTTLISLMYPLIVLLLSLSLVIEGMPEGLQCGDGTAI